MGTSTGETNKYAYPSIMVQLRQNEDLGKRRRKIVREHCYLSCDVMRVQKYWKYMS